MRESQSEYVLVGHWMTRDPLCVNTRDEVSHAYQLLADNPIRHLPVVAGKRRLAGILTKRDLLALTRAGRASVEGNMTVGMVMSTEVVSVHADEPLRRAAELLARHKYGCIPVTDDARAVVGIITEHDFVRWYLAHS